MTDIITAASALVVLATLAALLRHWTRNAIGTQTKEKP